MAKTIGNLGVIVSANTIGFQNSLRNASAGVRQFAATTKIAANLAGAFDVSVLRFGVDTAGFANLVRHSAPGITAGFAAMGGAVLGLATNFKELKDAATAAFVQLEDFISLPSNIGKDLIGGTPDRGPTMAASVQKQIELLRAQAAFDRGELTKRQFMLRRNRIEGAGAFGAQQLTEAELAADAAKRKNELSDRARSLMKDQKFLAEFEAEQAEKRLELEKQILAEREQASRDEFDASMQRFKNSERMAEETAIALGLAKPSRFANGVERDLLSFQERFQAAQSVKTGANFAISSLGIRGSAPIGEVFGQQREQQEIKEDIKQIRDIAKEFIVYLRANGLPAGAVLY